MEAMGLVTKKVFAELPRLSGRSLIPIIRLMDSWGVEHASLFDPMGNYTG